MPFKILNIPTHVIKLFTSTFSFLFKYLSQNPKETNKINPTNLINYTRQETTDIRYKRDTQSERITEASHEICVYVNFILIEEKNVPK